MPTPTITRHIHTLRNCLFHCIALILCLSFVSSATVLASGYQALTHFVTHVQTARGQFEQRQITAKPQSTAIKTRTPRQTTLTSPEPVLEGHFIFKRPGQFIWAITKPYEQVLQADGKNFYVYDSDLQQVTHRLLDEAVNGSSAAILFGRNNIEHSFIVHDEDKPSKGMHWVKLQPKQDNASFESIRIGFIENTLHAMEVHDAFGNITYFTFHHLEINPALPKDQFKFTLPPEAELVEG